MISCWALNPAPFPPLYRERQTTKRKSLHLSFPISRSEVIIIILTSKGSDVDELLFVKCLGQCLVHGKCYVRVTQITGFQKVETPGQQLCVELGIKMGISPENVFFWRGGEGTRPPDFRSAPPAYLTTCLGREAFHASAVAGSRVVQLPAERGRPRSPASFSFLQLSPSFSDSLGGSQPWLQIRITR